MVSLLLFTSCFLGAHRVPFILTAASVASRVTAGGASIASDATAGAVSIAGDVTSIGASVIEKITCAFPSTTD